MVDHDGAARMELTPEEIREEDGSYLVECPACGTPTTLMKVMESGHCAGADDDVGCTAELALELVWSE
ncbi:hypothetical protein ACFO0N_03230 [Halobium salinum]|uniref:Small CPxCG-related zinc finger protein n=1 Tax=Halobium salinum TaxID=1364940 RepID=A0ABD5P8B0_9EURY|nr:hypothetical protein [Halobium salinum]